MPACTIFILHALMDDAHHPFLNQISAQLCIPPEAISMNLFPSAFNATYDQVIAGTLMLGMHKAGMVLSNRLANDTNHDMTDKKQG